MFLGDYKLEHGHRNCKSIENSYFYKIDSYSKYRVFEENGVFKKLEKHQHFDKYHYLNDNFFLFANYYSGFDLNCLNNHPLTTRDNSNYQNLFFKKKLILVMFVIHIIEICLLLFNSFPLKPIILPFSKIV